MKKLALALLATSMIFASCQKDEDDNNGDTKTTSEKVTGQWKGEMVEVELYGIVNGIPTPPQTFSESISYLRANFQSNGTLILDSLGFDADTVSWSTMGDNKIIIDGEDPYDIELLNESNFNFSITEYDTISANEILVGTERIKLVK